MSMAVMTCLSCLRNMTDEFLDRHRCIGLSFGGSNKWKLCTSRISSFEIFHSEDIVASNTFLPYITLHNNNSFSVCVIGYYDKRLDFGRQL